MTNDNDILEEMRNSDEIFLFDIAGNIQKEYSKVIYYSNFIVVPFSYSDVTIDSTLFFTNMCRLLEIQGNLIFVRNNVDKNRIYINQPEMDVEFKRQGILLDNSVYKRNCLLTITTRKLNYEQKLAVKEVFEELIYNIKNYESSN